MLSECQRDVGFLARDVGSVSGFFRKPDISFANGISRLSQKCRECRVFLGGESAREIVSADLVGAAETGISHKPVRITPVGNRSWPIDSVNSLILLDLNDARN
jgi:hypothetical protein